MVDSEHGGEGRRILLVAELQSSLDETNLIASSEHPLMKPLGISARREETNDVQALVGFKVRSPDPVLYAGNVLAIVMAALDALLLGTVGRTGVLGITVRRIHPGPMPLLHFLVPLNRERILYRADPPIALGVCFGRTNVQHKRKLPPESCEELRGSRPVTGL